MTTSNRLDPTILRSHINALRVAYPEISEDEEAWLLTLESETELHAFLTIAVRRMLETQTSEASAHTSPNSRNVSTGLSSASRQCAR